MISGHLIGLGCDLCEVERLRGIWERQGERFLAHTFTDGERAYCLKMRDPAPYLAARFAAKEAVAKAFGTGIGAELGWRSIEVTHDGHGAPLVKLDSQGETLLATRGASGVLLTLSHTATMAMAVAALVKA
ncbi:MAG: holo-[acyl-carrier-protein] synthase [Verrucomicrobia bacterium]|nr:MAG: holo-[acyl-carrier-protein] synthase [Verrucomicrobiota bacterium]